VYGFCGGQARQLEPDNPDLVVNYSQLHGIDVIELCIAGEEPYSDATVSGDW
jgi:hypothetical protein